MKARVIVNRRKFDYNEKYLTNIRRRGCSREVRIKDSAECLSEDV